MHKDVESILFSKEEIANRVKELGEQITKDLAGSDLLVIGILKGGSIFTCDLIREINLPINLAFMSASSYGSGSVSSGNVIIKNDSSIPFEGKDLLIVEDIIDSGNTLSALKRAFMNSGANSVHICAFLDKPDRRKIDIKVDYVGYTIPDAFVVGYGLDFNESYRNLPYIGILKPEVYM